MPNYLTILANSELRKQFDTSTIIAMEKALVIYTSTPATKYNGEYEVKRQQQEVQKEMNDLFK